MEMKYMHRAIHLANRAFPSLLLDNPKVGAVIVHNDRIIGEGYHQKRGEGHAEVMAINNVIDEDKNLLKASTMYVTLEPCSHHGLTPPCSELIIKHNIKQLVIGSQDPTDKVNSIEMLRAAGISVELVRLAPAHQLIKSFTANHIHKLPFISLKWASSSDYYMGQSGEQVWLSNEASGIYTHKLRAYHNAILIGKNTVLTDKPSLTTRHYPGASPSIIILGYDPKIDLSNWLEECRKIYLLDDKKPSDLDSRISFIQSQNKEIDVLQLNQLYNLGIKSILVEGGATVLNHFIKKQLWDEAHIIQCKKSLKKGIKSPNITGSLLNCYTFITDKIYHLQSTKSKS